MPVKKYRARKIKKQICEIFRDYTFSRYLPKEIEDI